MINLFRFLIILIFWASNTIWKKLESDIFVNTTFSLRLRPHCMCAEWGDMLKYLEERKAPPLSLDQYCWEWAKRSVEHIDKDTPSMATEIELIKGFTESILGIGEVSIDNLTFKLFYKWSASLFIASSVLSQANQFFGDPIACETVRSGIVWRLCWLWCPGWRHYRRGRGGRVLLHVLRVPRPGHVCGEFWP